MKSSLQIRKNNGQFIPKLSENIPYMDEDVLYFGNVYPMFGHFLLEHMNRAYGLLHDEFKKHKVVLVNNELENRRGRKLRVGDIVKIDTRVYAIVRKDEN